VTTRTPLSLSTLNEVRASRYYPAIVFRNRVIDRCECARGHADVYDAAVCASALYLEAQRSFMPGADDLSEPELDDLADIAASFLPEVPCTDCDCNERDCPECAA